jgi:hypothetical protein
MESCEQAPGLNMLQHGQQVHEEYILLTERLQAGTEHEILQRIYNQVKLPPIDVLKNYHLFHDDGKPFCLEIGEDGKRRFPNHAEKSAEIYLQVFPEDKFTAMLIKSDMLFHNSKMCDIIDLWNNPIAPILYFTAWAEINANAKMFGGKDSTSYKIKAKHLIQAGKKFERNT